jgi:hypothetical protein
MLYQSNLKSARNSVLPIVPEVLVLGGLQLCEEQHLKVMEGPSLILHRRQSLVYKCIIKKSLQILQLLQTKSYGSSREVFVLKINKKTVKA